ncbi:hypothetical protein VKT23_004490 [Stygiomarasmius scandens]|uniref:Uncharacterized protein n=1 Tax=Marasmiellus scandens TaxID=2682957 RepID=A0ABR1JYK8_9AGAR
MNPSSKSNRAYKSSPLARSQASLDLEKEMKVDNKRRKDKAKQGVNLEEEMDYEGEIASFQARWAALAKLLDEPGLVFIPQEQKPAPKETLDGITFESIDVGF